MQRSVGISVLVGYQCFSFSLASKRFASGIMAVALERHPICFYHDNGKCLLILFVCLKYCSDLVALVFAY